MCVCVHMHAHICVCVCVYMYADYLIRGMLSALDQLLQEVVLWHKYNIILMSDTEI